MTSAISLKSLFLNYRRSVLVLSAIAISPGAGAIGQTVAPGDAQATAPATAHAPASVQIPATVQAPPAATSPDAPPPPGEKISFGYVVHQSIDLGGHIANHSGSGAVYDTMVNLQSGPRILSHSLDLRAADPSHAFFFDRLSTNSFGYGGDPNSVSFLNFSKGRLYDFRGNFRRDRQYFDYDLLSNPLIPAGSNPYVPFLDSPHLYNTVRRMTDMNLTLAPLSPLSLRLGYNHNVSSGPGYSTLHVGADALLTQNWRNQSDSWTAGLDWKPTQKTTFSYDEFITRYKGDTSWQLARISYQLADGTPVSLGVDLSSVWRSPCAAPFNRDGTVNDTCSGYLAYNRSAPTRTLFPTEQFRFESRSLQHVTMNGRFLYSATTNKLNNFNELFNGLDARAALRESFITGSARVRRVNVNADFGVTWQLTSRIEVSDVFDFWNFRMPGTNNLTETDYAGTSMLAPLADPTTTTTPDFQFINENTKANTFIVAWDIAPRARVSLGHRYRTRTITDAGGDVIPIHENWALFGAVLRPAPQWRLNLDVDAMYADNAFTRISPRHLQHYRLRTTYKPRNWLNFAGTANIFESRDNVDTVNHLEHNRDFSFGTSVSPSERWSFDLNYAYDSVYSSTIECYTSTEAPASAGVAPGVCSDADTPLLSTGYYNAPTQYGSLGFMVAPVKRIHLGGGYRMSAVNGNSDIINIRQVPGALQSQYQSPYGNLAFDLMPNWTWKADYNYYSFGEGSPIGPTLPRSFRGNVYTLGVRYAF